MFISRRKKMMTYKSEASIVFRTKIYLPNQAFIPCFYFQVYDRRECIWDMFVGDASAW